MQCMQNLKNFYLEIEHLGRVNLLEGTHARKYKKNTFFFFFCSLIRTFAADFKGCLRVQAEMIPSNLIRIIPA